MPDDLPSFADLRRKAPRRLRQAALLFDPDPPLPPGPTSPLLSSRSAVEGSAVSAPHVFTVSELVRTLRSLVESSYSHITVEGEISNWRPAASGHCYFTLKDGEAQLPVVLFRRQALLLRFRPRDGDAVRLRGQLSIYDARGQLQLIAESMEQTGLGALLAAVQALKDKLRREGLFDNARPLPPFPQCIGIVTSLQGAALRDIVKVCRRRHAAVNLLIYPAAVQGPNCAAEISAGVRWFSAHPDRADVVIVARGGGSWEDLHGFDDERVARAIAACSLPVITGIGHAPDSTIADAAADLCAPTPSAAAEMVTAAQHGIAERLTRLRARMERAGRYQLLHTRQRLAQLSVESVLERTRTLLERRAQHLDDLSFRVEFAMEQTLRRHKDQLNALETRTARRHPALRLSEDHRRLAALRARLQTARGIVFRETHLRLDRSSTQLVALSPLRVLERGYALVYNSDGILLRSTADAPENTLITAQLANGRLRAKVLENEN